MLGCGRCRRCRAGNGHVCADRHEIGITAWPGALADKVLVPATSLHRLPASVDDRAGALVEPGGNAQRAVAAAQAGPGRRILVCGPGTIGLLAVAFATRRGRRRRCPRGRPEPPGARGDVRGRPVLDRRGSAAWQLRRGHRLHRRSPGSGGRADAGRAGRAGGLHRRRPGAEPGRQPRHRAQRPDRGRDSRRVGRPGQRHRALRGRPGRSRARWRRSSSASTGRPTRWRA